MTEHLAPPEVVTIQKWKRPAGCGSWRGYVLGHDHDGWWVFTPAHSTFTGVHPDGRRETCEVAQDAARVGRSCVVLMPSNGWYVAHWVSGSDHLVDVDIATPPIRFGDTWAYDDLELDPFLARDGTFGVDDEVEFEVACGRGLIEHVARAHALEWLHSLRTSLNSVHAPLVTAGLERLGAGSALGLPPLR